MSTHAYQVVTPCLCTLSASAFIESFLHQLDFFFGNLFIEMVIPGPLRHHLVSALIYSGPYKKLDLQTYRHICTNLGTQLQFLLLTSMLLLSPHTCSKLQPTPSTSYPVMPSGPPVLAACLVHVVHHHQSL